MKIMTTLLAVLIGFIFASESYAVSYTCQAVRGNGMQNWTWTSSSRSYSWNKVYSMCQSSGARTCVINCSKNSTSDISINIPLPVPVVSNPSPQFSCTVYGLRGAPWTGYGPDLRTAHQNALANCRVHGIPPCHLNTCVRVN